MSYISALYRYPIKSCYPHQLAVTKVDEYGLVYDRRWALFNEDHVCLTGRNYPDLLDIEISIIDDSVSIFHRGKYVNSLPLISPLDPTPPLQIHSYKAFGHYVSQELDNWFSNLLQISCRFVQLDTSRKRPVLKKHGGVESSDVVGFSDQAPVLILSEASLADLNLKLDEKVPINRFRPNIVIADCDAYEEDSWKNIEINGTPFKIIQQCERCVFTTIDIESKKKHPKAEPLTTLASYRKGPRGGVILGVHAVPLGGGVISEKDTIKVLS